MPSPGGTVGALSLAARSQAKLPENINHPVHSPVNVGRPLQGAGLESASVLSPGQQHFGALILPVLWVQGKGRVSMSLRPAQA